MIKTQIYLPEEDLKTLHRISRQRKKSIAELAREAIRDVWITPQKSRGIVGICKSARTSSVDHDSIYDKP